MKGEGVMPEVTIEKDSQVKKTKPTKNEEVNIDDIVKNIHKLNKEQKIVLLTNLLGIKPKVTKEETANTFNLIEDTMAISGRRNASFIRALKRINLADNSIIFDMTREILRSLENVAYFSMNMRTAGTNGLKEYSKVLGSMQLISDSCLTINSDLAPINKKISQKRVENRKQKK